MLRQSQRGVISESPNGTEGKLIEHFSHCTAFLLFGTITNARCRQQFAYPAKAAGAIFHLFRFLLVAAWRNSHLSITIVGVHDQSLM